MVMRLYTIKDKLAQECGPVFSARNDAVASRNFKKLLEDTGHPEEYALYFLGEFENEKPKLTVCELQEVVL